MADPRQRLLQQPPSAQPYYPQAQPPSARPYYPPQPPAAQPYYPPAQQAGVQALDWAQQMAQYQYLKGTPFSITRACLNDVVATALRFQRFSMST
jgi:hypothetical protein